MPVSCSLRMLLRTRHQSLQRFRDSLCRLDGAFSCSVFSLLLGFLKLVLKNNISTFPNAAGYLIDRLSLESPRSSSIFRCSLYTRGLVEFSGRLFGTGRLVTAEMSSVLKISNVGTITFCNKSFLYIILFRIVFRFL